MDRRAEAQRRKAALPRGLSSVVWKLCLIQATFAPDALLSELLLRGAGARLAEPCVDSRED